MVRNFQYIFHRNDETYWNCLLKRIHSSRMHTAHFPRGVPSMGMYLPRRYTFQGCTFCCCTRHSPQKRPGIRHPNPLMNETWDKAYPLPERTWNQAYPLPPPKGTCYQTHISLGQTHACLKHYLPATSLADGRNIE